MPTFHIHIRGQVQGVGFRPFVYKLAQQEGISGWVNNTLDGVHVRFTASPSEAAGFYKKLVKNAPELSLITAHEMTEVAAESFDRFDIIHSDTSGRANVLLTPDFAMCPDCKTELLQPSDRRFAYPFITCTNCGPRFSIATSLPYDRDTTTMAVFPLCEVCAREYNDPLDRRYYSQTNSCPACGIRLELYHKSGTLLTQETAQVLEQAAEALRNGKILAVKGIGGFLIMADATNSEAIALLRQRKHRPGKPFAVLYPDLETLGKDVFLDEKSTQFLIGPKSPIVLLPAREKMPSGLDMEGVAPGLQQLGVLLPYTPLYELIMRKMARPVVATSGNVSGTPIVFRDQNALSELPELVDFLLINNREIAIPQDDSVIRVTEKASQSIVIRRSRGLAPTHLEGKVDWPATTILSMGAFLKSTFTLLHQGNTYISQYLGKLDYLETQEHYRHTLDHFLHLFKPQVEHIIVDSHPAYFSTQFGKELAEKWGVGFSEIQHHEAHFGAVLAENQLLQTDETVLGVIWDGTGLGRDGQIWGGEFFEWKKQSINRLGYFTYFPWILNDKMALEPRISALVAGHDLAEARFLLRSKFSRQEWRIYQNLMAKAPLQTSSVGRLFDAVSSILGLADKSSYEGQAAMLLEQLAKQSDDCFTFAEPDSYIQNLAANNTVSTTDLIFKVLEDVMAGNAKADIAAKFHYSLIYSIKLVLIERGIRKVAFSGGVWQNALLVDMAIHYLGKSAKLYFHRQLSPNDECISYGGLICNLFILKK